jgi:hypothetical protein
VAYQQKNGGEADQVHSFHVFIMAMQSSPHFLIISVPIYSQVSFFAAKNKGTRRPLFAGLV